MKQKYENRYKCRCNICGHQWWSRNDKEPWKCPSIECQSFKWNKGEPIDEVDEASRLLAFADKYEKEDQERQRLEQPIIEFPKEEQERIKKLKSKIKKLRDMGKIELADAMEQELRGK